MVSFRNSGYHVFTGPGEVLGSVTGPAWLSIKSRYAVLLFNIALYLTVSLLYTVNRCQY